MSVAQKCDCELLELFEAAKSGNNPLAVSRFSETTGFIWCDKHRVHVQFTAPKEAWGKSTFSSERPI